MKEGWRNGDYYILFDEREVEQITARYGVARYLPGFTVIGLKGWDDFIVRDAHLALFLVPTVPAIPRHLQALAASIASEELERDPRWEGKIKWWIKPIVFGGDPQDPSNSTWLSLEQHAQFVRWWNDLFQSLAGTER
jgi:hypothetical protein